MRYGIEQNDNGVIIFISPALDDDKYIISDIDNPSKMYSFEKDIESITGYGTNFKIDGSAENSIFIISDKEPREIEKLIVSQLKHTLVTNNKNLKKLSKEARSKSSLDETMDLYTYEGLKKYLETQKYTIKKAKELLNTTVAKNHFDLIAIVLDRIFMKISTEEKFFKSIEWFISDKFDFSTEIENIIAFRESVKDGDTNTNYMSTLLSAFAENSANTEALEKIKDKLESIKNDQYFLMVYEITLSQLKKIEASKKELIKKHFNTKKDRNDSL